MDRRYEWKLKVMTAICVVSTRQHVYKSEMEEKAALG